MTDQVIAGSCLCKSVRVRITPPTLFVSHCHCATCRAAHGAAFVTWTAVPNARFVLDDPDHALSRYRSSPDVERGFCSRCGTQMLYQGGGADRTYVPVAVLDSIDQPPDSHVSFEERAPWLAGCAALPCCRAKTSEPVTGDL